MRKLLGHNILIRPIEVEQKTSSGIILQPAVKKNHTGEVVDVGIGVEGHPMELKIGYKVAYIPRRCTEVIIDGETLLIADSSNSNTILMYESN
jgi:co-chaperonin GroES (HSP10)